MLRTGKPTRSAKSMRSNAVLNYQLGELSKLPGLTGAKLYMLQPKYLNVLEAAFRKLAERGVARPPLEAYGKGDDLTDPDVKRRVDDLVTIDSMAHNQALSHGVGQSAG